MNKSTEFHTVATDKTWTDAVVNSFLKDQGNHCPYCGSSRVGDSMQSDAYHLGWGICWFCDECDKKWWSDYSLKTYQGLVPRTRPKVGKRVYCKEPACPSCGSESDSFVYGTLQVNAGSLEQSVKCEQCQASWTEVNVLGAVMEAERGLT